VSDDVGTLLELVDRLDDVVHDAKPVPLTDQVRLDKDDVYAILDRIREVIPAVFAQAQAQAAQPPPAPEQDAPAVPVDLDEAARTLSSLAERVKFGGQSFRLDVRGMPMAELRPPRD
jgi:hypothetical protein